MGKVKKILVIGGTGFIGYHVISEALKRNWKVTSISLYKPKKKRYHHKVKYKFVQIENFSLLKKKITSNYDFVVNAGGYGENLGFDKEGLKLLHSHYQGTLNLAKIFSKKKLKNLFKLEVLLNTVMLNLLKQKQRIAILELHMPLQNIYLQFF